MFNPGETVVETFELPFLKSELSKVIVTYKNKYDDVFYVKTITSSSTRQIENENKCLVAVELSQQETLLFEENSCFKIQINVLTTGRVSRFASKEIVSKTGPQHIKEVVNNG